MSICLAHHLDAVSICRASPGIRFSRQFHWECVVRTTKHRETDGVAVFAKVLAQAVCALAARSLVRLCHTVRICGRTLSTFKLDSCGTCVSLS